MNKPRLILLADDNPDDQSFIRDAFSYVNANVQLKILDSGTKLLEHLRNIKDEELPSLIVLDYNMPQQNGAEVLKLLIQDNRYKKIPKIMLSTSYYQAHIDHCIKMGANGYLIKPDNVFSWKKTALDMLNYMN